MAQHRLPAANATDALGTVAVVISFKQQGTAAVVGNTAKHKIDTAVSDDGRCQKSNV
jgi:hypothetical protein